ncbi:MAG TPA: Hsp20/alpha crystallin family protein [Planctomycetota bacterium]|jgi:HSP20 family protein|nr:Hsp20/alpha crystallin family protein [Planctomycetota bacterium]
MRALIPFRTVDRELEPFPFRPFRREMDRLFEDFFGGNGGTEAMSWPAMDVVETKDNLIVKAEIPGLDPKDLNISVSEDFLTISGERKQETVKEEANRYMAERWFGEFRRTFRLPSWADPEKIEASFKNGVVELTIGKRAEAKPRVVKVRTA